MVQGRTLWELLERRVDATPDSLMVVDEDMSTLTFAEFWSEAELAAAGLHAAGLHAGDVVSWQMPNWVETFVLVAALSRLGVVQNPVQTALQEHEVERVVVHAGASLLVVPSTSGDRDLEDEATAIARRHGSMRVLVADRALPQGDPTSLPDPPEELDPEHLPVSWLFHTAGTTAEPKVVQHTDATVAVAARGLCQRLGLIAHDRHAFVLPAASVDGMVWLFASLLSGCSSILAASFETEDICEVLGREGVTLAGSGPEHHQAYVRHQRRQLHPIFPDVRAFTGAGSAKPVELVSDVRSVFDVPVLSAYGLTEAPVLTHASISDPDADLVAGEGTAVPGVEIRLVQLDGTIVTGGEEGEIRVRAPQMMRGYTDPALDVEAFDDDGFFRTGDLGRIDERGVVTITGQVKDIIVRREGNVSARELEHLLHLHEKVADVAVIGLPDPDSGEQVCAVVQVNGEHGELTIDEVIIHLRSRGLTVHDLPERLEIVETLPRTPSGSVLKHVLRDEFKG
jgi:cyclohexanecarboxylate-CoA ligase